MHFLEATNYCLGYSDSDDGGYDPSRECFKLKVGGASPNAQGGAGPSERRNATPPPNTTPGIHTGARGATSAPTEGRRPDLDQLNKLEARLKEERVRLRQLHETLVQDQSVRGDGGEARRRARDVNRRIIEDEGGDNPPVFSTASHNVMAAALHLRAMPEPSTPEGRRVRQGLRGLLEQAMVQNTESSASQSHGTRHLGDQPPSNKAPTVQGPPPPNPQGGNKAPSVHERVGTNVDTRATLKARRRDRDEAESRRYRPRRGGRYDPDHDRSTSPEPLGPASSARPSAGPSSRLGSDNPLTSPSTQGKLSMKASRQSTLGYTHGSSLLADGAQATNLMVTQDTDKLFFQVRPPCGRNTYVLRLVVLICVEIIMCPRGSLASPYIV